MREKPEREFYFPLQSTSSESSRFFQRLMRESATPKYFANSPSRKRRGKRGESVSWTSRSENDGDDGGATSRKIACGQVAVRYVTNENVLDRDEPSCTRQLTPFLLRITYDDTERRTRETLDDPGRGTERDFEWWSVVPVPRVGTAAVPTIRAIPCAPLTAGLQKQRITDRIVRESTGRGSGRFF